MRPTWRRLYTQHHEGNDAYRFEIYNDQLAEQAEDRDTYRRPIVDRHYSDPLDMFDATTHEKGAAVLDMLRYVVDGAEATSHPASQDELLFRALHHYLVAHHCADRGYARTDRVHSGKHRSRSSVGFSANGCLWPAVRTIEWKRATTPQERSEKVTVTQTQQVDAETPIFDMPIDLAFYGANGERKKIQVRDNLQRQEFEIPLDFEPQWVDFDPDDFIDKTVQFDKPVDALIAEAEKDPSMMSRLWAVQQLGTVRLPNRMRALKR